MAFERKENKNIKVTIRFTEKEKKIIDEHINENGYDNISSFIRELIKKELLF